MDHRSSFNHVFPLEVVIACVVFGLVLVVLTAAVVRSRTRWGRRAKPTKSHPKTEGLYVAIVAGLAVFLVVFSIDNNRSSLAAHPAMKVQVTAFQWCWRFAYTGTPVTVTGQCQGGAVPTLELPTGKTIEIDLTSSDVVHSMWVPYLRFKMQAFPDHVNVFDTRLDHPGSWPGRCAEFCGLYHSGMDFTLKAVPPAQFDSWLRSQEASA
ncbi:cytochrome c oxidase subunit II [Acidiferrimicrobium sp. IK]|uniref:cytochrome c oxidase subunit II n=1 Tax=Acidiferrimicrobium sp. IK TaxID=2871700 RepID=UPI0021CB98CF|nr:cytochrome c oxidase subunit II [Acidiferrimicrobium sp. IK]MCU4183112.1 cytochrome c oxidase subunit II [Acidiferrimicrobium sp. IK]